MVFESNEWLEISKNENFNAHNAQLVFVFGERKCLEIIEPYNHLSSLFPSAEIIINSTAGEIYQDKVNTETIIVTAIEFEKTSVRAVQVPIQSHLDSRMVGSQIAEKLFTKDLTAIFIISDGAKVNGSELIAALNEKTNNQIPVSGGLAGDEARFEKTLVGLNQNADSGNVVGIGFYGKNLKVGHGTMGGWEGFGPEREVTKSEYNVLYQIGDKAALDIYKEYLGKYADELPGAALLFPLSMRVTEEDEPVVRTILSIDEENKSMVFAGDMPEGSLVRFMRANLDRVIGASATAAQNSLVSFGDAPDLAILVSCVGRKLVMGQRTDEEIESVREIFGNKTIMTGFYSYGEISPNNQNARCELHNQTMTITTFTEI